MPGRPHIQLDEEIGEIGQIADESAQRQRQNDDQRRSRHDLVGSRQAGLLVDVDDLKFHTAFQLSVAQRADAYHGWVGPGGRTRHKEA